MRIVQFYSRPLEVKYEKVYIPEADPKNQGDFRVGPYGMNRTQLKVGGLAEIKKFNEGGINYLPSKMNRLYGVTMPEKGISQLVAVDLQKAEGMVA